MKEGYPFNRAHSPDQILERLGCNPVELATYLARKVNESPRIGELGGGNGDFTNWMSQERLQIGRNQKIGASVHNIDKFPAYNAFRLSTRGAYPDVRFTHQPHLIVAHNSVAALMNSNSAFFHYLDFGQIIGSLCDDVHKTVGTIFISSVMPIQTDISSGLDIAHNKGFAMIVPSDEVVMHTGLQIVLTRDTSIEMSFFRNIQESIQLIRSFMR